jgi:hypothetical protein
MIDWRQIDLRLQLGRVHLDVDPFVSHVFGTPGVVDGVKGGEVLADERGQWIRQAGCQQRREAATQLLDPGRLPTLEAGTVE